MGFQALGDTVPYTGVELNTGYLAIVAAVILGAIIGHSAWTGRRRKVCILGGLAIAVTAIVLIIDPMSLISRGSSQLSTAQLRELLRPRPGVVVALAGGIAI